MNLADGVTRMLARLYAASSSPLTFRHPKTRQMVSLAALDRSAQIAIKDGPTVLGKVKIMATVMQTAVAALGLERSDLVDLNVIFNGAPLRIAVPHDKPDPSWKSNLGEFKPVPSWRTAAGEILLELIPQS